MDCKKKTKTSNFNVMEKNNNFLNKIKTHPIGPLKIRMNNDIELEKNQKFILEEFKF